tara:strand:+ start:267 stop:1991 length:1725 start_codon:yes stop_codon:yes gene_type:complete
MTRLFNSIGYLLALLVVSMGCVQAGPAMSAGKNSPAKSSKEKKTAQQKEVEAKAKEEREFQALSHLAAAQSHLERGEEQEALEEYYKAALANPSDKKVVMEVVQRLVVNRQRDKAFKLLVEATKNPSAPAELHGLLATRYLEKKKPDLAKKSAEKAIEKSPKSIVGYKTMMQVFRYEIQKGEKRKDQIKGVIDQALAQKEVAAPFKIELALMMAGFLSIEKEAGKELKPKIIELLDNARGSKPEKPALLGQIAQAYRLAGAHKQAAKAMETLLKALPDNAAILLETAREHAMAGDLSQAKLHLEAMVEKFPRNWRGYQLLAAIAMDEEEYDLAAKHYREVIRLNSRMETIYYDLVQALLAADKIDKAQEELKKAQARFNPNFMQAYFSAMIKLEKKEYLKAHTELLEAEKLAKKAEPDRLTHILYFQLGSTAERAKKYKDAEKFFRQSIEMQPNYATALNYLGYMWADRNENLKEAEEFIRRALKEAPDNPAYQDSLAWVYFRKGEFKNALEWQLKALKNSDEPDPEILLHLGQIYGALRDKVNARKYLNEASKIEDTEEDVKAKIQEKLKELD